MLECRNYTFAELTAYIHTNDVEATTRKLDNYDIEYELTGRGKKAVFSIKAINNPFKVFAVFELGAAPQTNFKKFGYFILELLIDEEFRGIGMEMMEERLRDKTYYASRQTISKYIRCLTNNNIISQSTTDFVYYRVFKRLGVQCHEKITKEEYASAWKYYFYLRNEQGYNSSPAYQSMYNKFRGVPRKFGLLEQCAFYNELYKWLIDILIEEVGDLE